MIKDPSSSKVHLLVMVIGEVTQCSNVVYSSNSKQWQQVGCINETVSVFSVPYERVAQLLSVPSCEL